MTQDPIFAAIDRVRQARATFSAAVAKCDALTEQKDSAAEMAAENAAIAEDEAVLHLLVTPPATSAGALALLIEIAFMVANESDHFALAKATAIRGAVMVLAGSASNA